MKVYSLPTIHFQLQTVSFRKSSTKNVDTTFHRVFIVFNEPGSTARVQTIRQRSRSRVARVETTTFKRSKLHGVNVEHVNVFFGGGHLQKIVAGQGNVVYYATCTMF